MMSESTKDRIEWIDVIKGMAIISMVLGHCLSLVNPLRPIIFSFHMPLFIVISGLFYKKISFKVFVIKQLKGLFIPYALTVMSVYFLYFLLYNWNLWKSFSTGFSTLLSGFSVTNQIQIPFAESVSVIWFLPMLFCIKTIFHLLEKLWSEKYLLIGLVSFCLAAAGYYLSLRGYWLPFSLDVSLYGLFFYYVGYMMGKFKVIPILLRDLRCVLLFLFIWIFGLSQNMTIEMATRHYPGIFTCMIIAFSGSIVVIAIACFVSKINILKKILGWYGAGSIYVLCLHRLEWTFFPYAKFGINVENEMLIFIAKLLVITIFYIVILKLKKGIYIFHYNYFNIAGIK